MIPSVIATQVQRGLKDFLRTTYPPEDPFFADILENFFKESGTLFRGPFLSLKLPFRPGTGKAASLYPELPMKIAPYLHQEIAFERLSAEKPLSTLIATGTGSGKTECFMYPLLDYCWRHRGERGIKAIIIYPMNALATDQARRFAREIDLNPNLKGNVSAGLFIGGEKDSDGFHSMTADTVITCKNTMRQNPPDILMTNYKMLDFLLLRPKDYPIWQFNTAETLKYIAVDELHTFDGAQGTDLACLLRRLMRRLKTPAGYLCYAGTSATLGDGEDGRRKMLSFAGKLFGVEFDDHSIITEDVLKPSEFLGDDLLVKNYPIPDESDLAHLRADNFATETEYLKSQCRLWFGDDFILPENCDNEVRFELGRHLREHLFFQNLIRLLNSETVEEENLSAKLDRIIPGFTRKTIEFQTSYIDSIFALISFARRKIIRNDGVKICNPFLQVRVQLWLREMRRMVATVEENPRLRFSADLRKDETVQSLPLVHCRNCGHVGYLSFMPQTENTLSSDLDKIYHYFFASSPTLQYIFHDDEDSEERTFPRFLCGHCLTLSDGENVKKCPTCGKDDKRIRVKVINPRQTNSNGHVHVYKNCPFCDGVDSLTVLGSRSASMTSVVISQLFASQYNDDPKLLAFSDSVQDASHRAGFFSARTYRFNLRAAIQQVLDETKEKLTLEALPNLFLAYWKKKLGGAASFAAQFTPPDLQWYKEYEEMLAKGTISEGSPFFTMIRNRIHWEILSEYGYRSRIGRTLEKSGCSILHLSPALLDQWGSAVHQKLIESIGPLRKLTISQVKRFLVGFVRMMRIRGGISAEYMMDYMKTGNTVALHNNYPFLPEFGRGRAPVFPTLGHNKPARFDQLIASGHSLTSYQKLLTRCWTDVIYYSSDIFQTILDAGCEFGILKQVATEGFSSYGLNPAAVELENNVEQFACDHTRHLVSTPHSEHELWLEMPSPRLNVPNAKLFQQEEKKQDYYGELYRYGKVHRVIAREHTGLLQREDREKLEESFIRGAELAAPNILSCTPTLEMGINIGDLSSVILCSMPPAQANYVQRIGRAGRRDGNAFNFVVAAQKPHDLHFFAEPLEMISGEVTPPGIFLNAPAVLERQLTAFCFDRWIESIAGNPACVPENLKPAVEAVANQNQRKFPYTFLKFIDLQRSALIKDFCEAFPGILTEETQTHLQNFMRDSQNDGLGRRILGRLEFFQKKRKNIQEKLQTVRNKLLAIAEKPVDQSTKDEKEKLLIEKHTLQDSISEMDKKQTFNFFTDEGLLPNYAFPEAGVTLQSVIYRKRNSPDAQGRLYDTMTYEYERSGKSAIQEFAPGNVFFVDGRKLVIGRINMTDTAIERWHFCSCCNHVEKVTDNQHTATCPKCGSPTWADGNLTRNVLRMKQVVSNLSEKESRSYDESDERDPVFFNKHMLAELSPEYVEKAYKVADDNFPFGLEFLRKATFREINFGEQELIDGNSIDIAAHKVSRNGFLVCKDCGAVAQKDKPIKHAVTCKHYGKTDSKGIVECLYLYREFESEALRLLLPLEEIDFDSNVHSFIAALYMGLQERFEGSVDHLQVMIHEEPLPDSSMKKRFVVIYDQIPGGTGYLKQLANSPVDFMNMLQTALDKLQQCRCELKGKDGCYSCLYAYRVSHDLPDISRKSAIELFAKLLSRRSLLQQTDSIDKISVNALFDSDLEKRFIEGFRRCSSEKISVNLQMGVYDGKTGYQISVNEYSYKMVPQVEIGIGDGVSVPCRADFVIYPIRKQTNGIPPIVIFTDGYQFHADLHNGNYRFHKDLEQRMALVKSGKFLCWSLSYQDVMTKFDLKHSNTSLSDIMTMNLGQPQYLKFAEKQNPFDVLITLLANPFAQDWKKLASSYAFSFSQKGKQKDVVLQQIEEKYIHSLGDLPDIVADPSGNSAFWKRCIENASARIHVLSILFAQDARKPEKVRMTIRIQDKKNDIDNKDFQKLWNDILQAGNILQFIADFIVVSDRFIEDGLTVPICHFCEVNPDEWQEIIRATADAVHPVILQMKEKHLRCPIPGYELTNSQGRVIASAELAWPEQRLAVLLNSMEYTAFSEQGWKVFIVSENTDIASLDNLFHQLKDL